MRRVIRKILVSILAIIISLVVLMIMAAGIAYLNFIFLNSYSCYTETPKKRVIMDNETKICYYGTTMDTYPTCPYYSENGKLVRYIDGEFVEVS